jgi:hypothetical protein
VEGVAFALDDDAVPGVRAAVVADDSVVLAGEEVDDLALAFIAPLEADNRGAWRCGHAA